LAYLFTLIYIFTIPFENALLVEGIGSVSRAAGIPILALWVLLLVLKQQVRVFVPFFAFSLLFIIWCSFSLLWGQHPDIVTLFLFTYVQLFLASFFIWLTLNDKTRCIRALQFYLIGAYVAAGFVIWNFYTNDLATQGDRSGIEGVDLNELAMSISLALPIAWYLATRSRIGLSGVVMASASYVFLPIGMLAIMMTGSRGGFASVVPTALYIVVSLLYVGKGAKIVAGIAIAVSIVVVLQYVPEAQFQRIMTFSEEIETGNISGRGDLWRAAVQIWLESPSNSIIGIGLGGFGMEVGMVAHNTYLSVLSETGLIGFIIYLLILISLVVVGFRSQREVRYLLLTLLMVWGLGAAALTWEYAKLTWLVWCLIVCVAYVFQKHPRRSTRKRRRRRTA
jgi:O-antigen ligase